MLKDIKICYQDGDDFFIRKTNGLRVRLQEKDMTIYRLKYPNLVIGSCREVAPEKEPIVWN